MRISETGLDLIRHFEGERLQTYKCSAGVDTIGVGHTGPDVKPGMTITHEQSEELLRKDLAKFERAVEELVKVDLAQDEFDSLVALVFNIGPGNFKTSTLLRKLNAGDYASAALEFLRWDKVNKKTVPGLTRRREAESRLFQGFDWR